MPDEPKPPGTYGTFDSVTRETSIDQDNAIHLDFLGGPASPEDATLINQIFAAFGASLDLKSLELSEEAITEAPGMPRPSNYRRQDSYGISTYEIRNISIDPALRQVPLQTAEGTVIQSFVPVVAGTQRGHSASNNEVEAIAACIDACLGHPTIRRCVSRKNGELEFGYDIPTDPIWQKAAIANVGLHANNQILGLLDAHGIRGDIDKKIHTPRKIGAGNATPIFLKVTNITHADSGAVVSRAELQSIARQISHDLFITL